jgi:HAE1 family hydrophobic/amphiphilic exporter-1
MISMLVSFSLTPMLASRWLRKAAQKNGNGKDGAEPDPHDHNTEHDRASSKKRGFYHLIERVYLAMLGFCLRHRWVVVGAAILLVASIPYQMKHVGKNFIPEEDESEFIVRIRAPEGTSLEATQLMAARVARDIRTLNGVQYTMASTADTEQRIANLGNVYVRLVETKERVFSQLQMMDYIRREVIPKYSKENIRVSIIKIDAIAGGSSSFSGIFVVGGPDIKKLEEYAKKLMERLKNVPGAVDVDSSLIMGKPQYGVKIDRDKADDLGVAVSDIATTIRLLLAGDKVSDFSDGGEMYDVNVRATPESRSSVDLLRMVTVPSRLHGAVPLESVVRFEESTGPSQIDRLNRARQVTISANMAPGASLQDQIDALQQGAKELNMGPEYRTMLIGESEEMAKSMKAFLTVFILAFIFAYLVMAAQFESWLHPITVLLGLPMVLPFAIFSLIVFGQSLNIFSILGILVLFAVINKNAILQIDHTNQLRAEGLPRFEAIMAANLDRLRPILMTTVAFVAGMIPLMISTGAGAQTNKALSSVVIGGQSLSLLFTLLATPVAYSLFDDLSNLIKRITKRN